jgi:predicted amidohydrolase
MTRIAVVQPALELGEVEQNLARVEDLIRDAHREHGAAVIVVPEGFTTPNVYARVLRGTARPVDGQPLQMLTRLARELDCVLAGGFIAVRGRHTYGTFVLAEPDGAVHLHDKDIPTAWEQHYYVGGDDTGVVQCATLGCTVGLMSGWEWARFRTAGRVRAEGVRLVLGGMCWPSMPLNWPGPLRWWALREQRSGVAKRASCLARSPA